MWLPFRIATFTSSNFLTASSRVDTPRDSRYGTPWNVKLKNHGCEQASHERRAHPQRFFRPLFERYFFIGAL
jgi:hypothetical protein